MDPAKKTKLDANFPASSVRHIAAYIWVQTRLGAVRNVKNVCREKHVLFFLLV